MKKIFTLAIAIAMIALTANSQNIWTQKAYFGGTPRKAAAGFSIGNKGYIGTGYYGIFLNDFWEYDPVTDVWSQKANFAGTPRYGVVAFAIGNKGYMGIGYGGSYQNDFWEYDPSLNTWTQKANFIGTGRAGAVGFSISDKGYVSCGYDGSVLQHDLWEYDPTSDTWTQKSDFGGIGRTTPAKFSIGNKGYIGLGYDGTLYPTDFWEYDPLNDIWTQITDFPGVGRTTPVAFSIGDRGFVCTGWNSLTGSFYNDLWEYNPDSASWSQKADFGGAARQYSTGFSIGSKGYVGTGNDASYYYGDFWEYTPELSYSVTTNSISPHACPGSSINIHFTAFGFNAGNIFTAQLSDASGSFASPVDIGTFSGTSSGIIEATIPVSTSASQHYRIRVIASDPAAVGTDNGSDIAIKCFTPTDLAVNQVAATKAKLSWKNTHCDVSYTFALQQVGTNYWNTLTTSYHYMTLFGLHPATSYVFKVRTNCSDAVQSPWSATESFTTGPLREGAIGDNNNESLILYPNPTAETFTLNLKLDDEENSQAIIQVINMLGQVVYNETTSLANGALQKEIQFNDAIDGMYLVKVIINDQVFTAQINLQK